MIFFKTSVTANYEKKIYDLSIENGTVFKKLVDLGKLSLPNDDEAYKNSELTNLILKDSGYSRYEISNYSIPGHQSRHNRIVIYITVNVQEPHNLRPHNYYLCYCSLN